MSALSVLAFTFAWLAILLAFAFAGTLFCAWLGSGGPWGGR